jgi:site-specific DNA-cytosine methylase
VTYTAVDCLGFAGGFTMGMVTAGFQLTGKREMKGGFGVANCEANRHLLGDGWEAESSDPAHWTVPGGRVNVVFGNPPCSGFSVMSAKEFRGANSKINHCMWAFVEFAARCVPEVAVFESVQMAFTRPDGLDLMRRLRDRLEELTNERYTLHHVLHNALAVGGSSFRRRYFWVASRVPFGVDAVAPARVPVLDEIIGDLTTLPESWELVPYDQEPSWWAAGRRSPVGRVDGHVSVDNPLTRRIRDLICGTTWRPGESISTVARRYHQSHGRLPISWMATEQKVLKNDFNMGFTTPVRWDGARYSRVITGGSLVTTVHPHLPRTLTHREVARIMGFPDDWRIAPLRGVSGLQSTWGKGITVDCGSWIGGWIRDALKGDPGSYAGEPVGDREFLVDGTHWYDSNLIQLTSTTKKYSRLLGIAPPTSPTKGHRMTEPEAPAEAVASKGRPRPQATIDRDNKAYEAIVAATEAGTPLTKETLATAIGVQPNEAYLSLYRLRVDNKIHKTRPEGGTGPYVWVPGEAPAAVEEAPAEAPAI